jgi:DNA-binding NtrC family response regulator
MSRRPHILVVAQTPSLANAIVSFLDSSRYLVKTVGDFALAKIHLDLEPDLLVTELRLGEYNGLHLALRAQARQVPAVVIGDPDPVLENDAAKFGATFLRAADLRSESLNPLISTLVASSPGPRDRVAWLEQRSRPLRIAGSA